MCFRSKKKAQTHVFMHNYAHLNLLQTSSTNRYCAFYAINRIFIIISQSKIFLSFVEEKNQMLLLKKYFFLAC